MKANFLSKNTVEYLIVACLFIMLCESIAVFVAGYRTYEVSHYSYAGRDLYTVTSKYVDNSLIFPFSIEIYNEETGTRIKVPSTSGYFDQRIGDVIPVDVYTNLNMYYYIPVTERRDNDCFVQYLS